MRVFATGVVEFVGERSVPGRPKWDHEARTSARDRGQHHFLAVPGLGFGVLGFGFGVLGFGFGVPGFGSNDLDSGFDASTPGFGASEPLAPDASAPGVTDASAPGVTDVVGPSGGGFRPPPADPGGA
jgi:hypothetical protein